ncbi:hypothetical protein M422DRAFT_263410 [Sphaerobolus stellatus SS14]|uniref:CCHC-type domain-containing protein n=1 Tax=Sphaerobolus stellatus (strain SS14) TaxID=990650 RepID=A0A0C9VAG1_SPHS4|nr:hypothetical protein M422DRAFT_263410 [Sphaerobolus stellatus SS14]
MDEDTPSEMFVGRGFQVQPSNLSDFNGDHEKGQSFLNSCSLYFSIAGRTFQDEQACISWALTFFKAGQAASFADQILRTQSRTGKPYFANWSAFELEFQKCFTPRNRQVQIQWAIKFKKGLSKSLRTTVSTTDPPLAFNDLEAWIEVAQRVADISEWTLPPAPPARTFNYQARLPIPVVNTRPKPIKIPDGPVPMDVDRTRSKASISNIVCRHCGKTGHIARFCDTNFDVWSLTVEEKEELLYGFMADLDMSENPGAELSSEEEVVSRAGGFCKVRRVNTVPSLPVHNCFSILDKVSTITQHPQSEKLLLQVTVHPPASVQNKTPFY